VLTPPSSRGRSSNVARRILVVDDNPAIHRDFRALLCPEAADAGLEEAEASLFGDVKRPAAPAASFQVDTALQGRDAIELVRRAVVQYRRYALAFVDMRMPPGWDGIETISKIWVEDGEIEVVICSAYSDYSWHDVVRRLGKPDRLRLLIKPFESKDVLDLAWSLTTKWLRRITAQELGKK
jgi:CheY-like chemotaxis protein